MHTWPDPRNQSGYGFEYAVDMPYNQDGTIDYVKLGRAHGCGRARIQPGWVEGRAGKGQASTESSGRCYLIDAICVKLQACDMGLSIANIKSWAPEV